MKVFRNILISLLVISLWGCASQPLSQEEYSTFASTFVTLEKCVENKRLPKLNGALELANLNDVSQQKAFDRNTLDQALTYERQRPGVPSQSRCEGVVHDLQLARVQQAQANRVISQDVQGFVDSGPRIRNTQCTRSGMQTFCTTN